MATQNPKATIRIYDKEDIIVKGATKRKLITVTNSEVTPLTNYQVELVVTYTSSMTDAMWDLRVVDYDRTFVYPVYRDFVYVHPTTPTGNSYAILYFKPETLAVGANYFWLYYGNTDMIDEVYVKGSYIFDAYEGLFETGTRTLLTNAAGAGTNHGFSGSNTTEVERRYLPGYNGLYIEIDATNDKLQMAYGAGAIIEVTLTHEVKEAENLCSSLVAVIGAALTCTCKVTFSYATGKFTFTPSASTLTYQHEGSTAGLTLGLNTDHTAVASFTSDFAIETVPITHDSYCGNITMSHYDPAKYYIFFSDANTFWTQKKQVFDCWLRISDDDEFVAWFYLVASAAWGDGTRKVRFGFVKGSDHECKVGYGKSNGAGGWTNVNEHINTWIRVTITTDYDAGTFKAEIRDYNNSAVAHTYTAQPMASVATTNAETDMALIIGETHYTDPAASESCFGLRSRQYANVAVTFGSEEAADTLNVRLKCILSPDKYSDLTIEKSITGGDASFSFTLPEPPPVFIDGYDKVLIDCPDLDPDTPIYLGEVLELPLNNRTVYKREITEIDAFTYANTAALQAVWQGDREGTGSDPTLNTGYAYNPPEGNTDASGMLVDTNNISVGGAFTITGTFASMDLTGKEVGIWVCHMMTSQTYNIGWWKVELRLCDSNGYYIAKDFSTEWNALPNSATEYSWLYMYCSARYLSSYDYKSNSSFDISDITDIKIVFINGGKAQRLPVVFFGYLYSYDYEPTIPTNVTYFNKPYRYSGFGIYGQLSENLFTGTYTYASNTEPSKVIRDMAKSLNGVYGTSLTASTRRVTLAFDLAYCSDVVTGVMGALPDYYCWVTQKPNTSYPFPYLIFAPLPDNTDQIFKWFAGVHFSGSIMGNVSFSNLKNCSKIRSGYVKGVTTTRTNSANYANDRFSQIIFGSTRMGIDTIPELNDPYGADTIQYALRQTNKFAYPIPSIKSIDLINVYDYILPGYYGELHQGEFFFTARINKVVYSWSNAGYKVKVDFGEVWYGASAMETIMTNFNTTLRRTDHLITRIIPQT